MLVRILKPMQGILDGVSLTTLVPGAVYDVEPSLGLQLIALGGARGDLSKTQTDFQELVDSTDSASLVGGVSVVPPPEKADDSPPGTRQKRR
jgi:hypothetical protein